MADPRNPALIGQWVLPGYAWNVKIAGGFAFVCTFHEGLRIIDVSNPHQPTLELTYLIDCYSAQINAAR